MSYGYHIRRLFKSQQKRPFSVLWLPVCLSAHRRTAGAIIFGGAALFFSGGAIAPALFSGWPRQTARLSADADPILSLDAVVTEPETSAIRLEPIPVDSKGRSR